MISPGIIEQPHYILPGTKLDMDLRQTLPKCRLTTRTVTIDGGSTFDAAGRDFDGDDDTVNIAHATDLMLGTADFQIHVWLKATDPQARTVGVCVGKGTLAGSDPNEAGWALRLRADGANDGKWQFTGDNLAISAYSTDATYEDGLLHLVSAIRASGVVNLYIDNAEVGTDASATADLDDNNAAIEIGAHDEGGAVQFTGKIVRVQIATATRTEAQAGADMAVIWRRGAFSH